MAYAGNEQDKIIVLQCIKKRRKIYTLCFFAAWAIIAICVVLAIKVHPLLFVPGALAEIGACLMASFIVWCINNYRSVLYDGQTGGGGFVWFFWLLMGGLIMPLIVCTILSHIDLGYKIIGCEKVE